MLSETSTKSLIQSLVISRLDYGNNLLCGLPNVELTKLQSIQNKAARLITLTSRNSHIQPVLKKLHWLPPLARIEFKVLLLVYKAINGIAPRYISELLVKHKPVRQLRSSAQSLLQVPKSNLVTVGDHAFSVFAPKAWNHLPLHIRQSSTLEKFKSSLKTHLFNSHYKS